MPKGFTKQFAERLSKTTGFVVKEAEEGDVIKDGMVLMAPGDYHMVVQNNRKIHLDSSEKRFGVRPAVNMTMISVSEVFGSNIVGVILTGMGHDGGFGMKSIKKRGGHTIVQNKETSVIFGMPQSVIDLDAADNVLPLNDIAKKIEMEVQALV
jgi:two-component system chemotaxis response regulator CheB